MSRKKKIYLYLQDLKAEDYFYYKQDQHREQEPEML